MPLDPQSIIATMIHAPLDPAPRYDDVFFEGMKVLDSEEEETISLDGKKVRIPADVLQSLLKQAE